MSAEDNVREFSSIEDILEGDESNLKSLILKHEHWLKTETIQNHHCKVVHLSCKEFCESRNNPTPFVDLIQRELQQAREMFIIRPHAECQTPLRKSFNESNVDEIASVDSLSYMKYAPLTSLDKGFIFRRVLKDEPMKFALNKIKEKTGSDAINIKNLRKINSQTSMHDLNEDTTLYDFDFKHNWEIVSREAIQIENVGCLPSLSNPEPHYLQPSTLISPLCALSFKPDNGVAGVTSSYTYCGLPGASTPMHNEDLNFASFNQNLGNGKKAWVSSLFNHSFLMWNLLKEYNNEYPDRKDLCRAHFRKKADFLFLTQLKEWDVGFKIAIQLPGDIVVTPTSVSHQVTTIDYTINEAINFCDNLWFKPQTNFLKLCKYVTKHAEAHGQNYESLVKTSNFRPEFLQHKWEIWQNENISRTNFQPINYETCQMCNPPPPMPTTNDTSRKDPDPDPENDILSPAPLLSQGKSKAEAEAGSATLEQSNRKVPCTTNGKSGPHWTELAEAVVLISPLKITNYLSDGKYLIKPGRSHELATELISTAPSPDQVGQVDELSNKISKNATISPTSLQSLPTTTKRGRGRPPKGPKTTHREASCTKANTNTAEPPQELVADTTSPVEASLENCETKISKVAPSQNCEENQMLSPNKNQNLIIQTRESLINRSTSPGTENGKPNKKEKTCVILLSRIKTPISVVPVPVQNVVPNNNIGSRENKKFSQFNRRLATKTAKLVTIRRKAQELSTLFSHTKAHVTAKQSRTKAKQPQPLRVTISRQFSRSPSITQISKRRSQSQIGNTAKKGSPPPVNSSSLGATSNICNNSNGNDKNSTTGTGELQPIVKVEIETKTETEPNSSNYIRKLVDPIVKCPSSLEIIRLHSHSPAKSTNQIESFPSISSTNNTSQNNIRQELPNGERKNLRSLVNNSITNSTNNKNDNTESESNKRKSQNVKTQENCSILSTTRKTRSSEVDHDEVLFLGTVQGKESSNRNQTHVKRKKSERALFPVPVENRRRRRKQQKVKIPKKIVNRSKNSSLSIKSALPTANNKKLPHVTQATELHGLLKSPIPITVQSVGLETNQRQKRQRTQKMCPCCTIPSTTASSVKLEPEPEPEVKEKKDEEPISNEVAVVHGTVQKATGSRKPAHELLHSAILKALCHICGKSFKNKYALDSHLQRKHADWRIMEFNRGCDVIKESNARHPKNQKQAKSQKRTTPGHDSEFASLETEVNVADEKLDLNVTLPWPLKTRNARRRLRSQNKPTSKCQKKPEKAKRKDKKSKKHRHKELLSSYEKPAYPSCEKSCDSKKYAPDGTHLHTANSPLKEFHYCECGKAYKHRSDLLRHIRHGKLRKRHNGEKCKLKWSESSYASRRSKQGQRSLRRLKTDPKMEELTLKMGMVGFLEDDDNSSLDQSSSQPKNERSENSKRTRFEELLYPLVRPTCHLCQRSFKNKYVLDAHVHITHTTVKKFQCNCGLTYKNRSDLQRHHKNQRLKKINDMGYNSDCMKPSIVPLSSHRSLQTLNSKIRKEPKRNFASIVSLAEGSLYHSVPNSDDHEPTSNSIVNTISNVETEAQTDARCSATRPKTKKGNTPRTSLQELLAPLTRPTCPLCEKSFKNKYALDCHIKFTHSSEKRFKCECGKAYKNRSDLIRHQKERELIVCNNSASDSDDPQPTPNYSNLNTISNNVIETQANEAKRPATRHETKKRKCLEESVSSLARPTCHLCKKSFKNKNILDSHVKFTHSTVRKFQCRCGKTYKSPSDLQRHRKKQRS